MDKFKEFFNKYKKYILIILALLLLIILSFLIFTKKDSGKVGKYDLSTIQSLSNIYSSTPDQDLIVLGKITNLEGINSFQIVDEDGNTANIYYVDLESGKSNISIEDLSLDNYVIVEGNWNSTYYGIVASKITKLGDDEYKEYMLAKVPVLEAKIVDHTESISHACATPKFTLRITNVGKIPVSHQDLYDRDFGYAFYHVVDGSNYKLANSEREDYASLIQELDDSTEIGLLSNNGFLYFDELKPGKSIEVEYWGGGKVTQSLYSDLFNDDGSNRRAGVGGEHNIFSGLGSGEHTFSIGWAKKTYDTPEFLSQSNEVTINLIDGECNLSDEYITDTFMVEPL